MKIAIAGSGAMGSCYGHMLAQAGNEVVLLDNWEVHVSRINEFGLKVNEVGTQKVTKIPAYLPSEFTGTVDLVIIFTKSLALIDMIESVKHVMNADTKVLCLLNGLGHSETLAKYVDRKNILMGVTVVTASLSAPGSVGFTNYGKTEIQNLDPSSEAAAREVVKVINDAGLPTEYSSNIAFSIWRKACINGVCNSLCTILDANMLELGMVPNVRSLVLTVCNEFAAVANAVGVKLDGEQMTDYVSTFLTPEFKGAIHYPSMHQDLIKNHRYTEVDYLNGYVARKGRELGIPTPYNELITLLVHGKETVLRVQ